MAEKNTKSIAEQLLDHPTAKNEVSFISRMLIQRASMTWEGTTLFITPCDYTRDLWASERYISEINTAVKLVLGEVSIKIKPIEKYENKFWEYSED